MISNDADPILSDLTWPEGTILRTMQEEGWVLRVGTQTRHYADGATVSEYFAEVIAPDTVKQGEVVLGTNQEEPGDAAHRRIQELYRQWVKAQPAKREYSHRELIDLCEHAVHVHYSRWREPETEAVMATWGRLWARLQASCPYTIQTTTNHNEVILKVRYPGEHAIDDDVQHDPEAREWEEETFIIPTRMRMEMGGDPWY